MSNKKESNIIKRFNFLRIFYSHVYSSLIKYKLGSILIIISEIETFYLNSLLAFFDCTEEGGTLGVKLGRLKKNKNFNKNEYSEEAIVLFEKLISDYRNPLIHARYFLGYGNCYEWRLSYRMVYWDKKEKKYYTKNFTLSDADSYAKEIIKIKNDIGKIYYKIV